MTEKPGRFPYQHIAILIELPGTMGADVGSVTMNYYKTRFGNYTPLYDT